MSCSMHRKNVLWAHTPLKGQSLALSAHWGINAPHPQSRLKHAPVVTIKAIMVKLHATHVLRDTIVTLQ